MRARRTVQIFLATLAIFVVVCLARLSRSHSTSQFLPANVIRSVEQQVRTSYSLPANVNISMGVPRSSEFAGYDTITITLTSPGNHQDFEFLISRDRKTLLRMMKFALATDPDDEGMKVKISVSGRPTRGNKASKVTVVSYDDFECPFCSSLHAMLFPTLLKKYGDRVLFVYKDYPLEEIHPWAMHAAVNANCLGEQNGDAYWDYADYLYSNQRAISGEKGPVAQKAKLDELATLQAQQHNLNIVKLQGCLNAQDEKVVRASMQEGKANGVEGTPSMFINGRKVDGVLAANGLQPVLDQALRDEGVAPPEDRPEVEKGKTVSALPAR